MSTLLSGLSSRRRGHRSKSRSRQDSRGSPEPDSLSPMQSTPVSRNVSSSRLSLKPAYSHPHFSAPDLVHSPEPEQASPDVHLGLRVESPPLVMYGARSESTGALLTGIFDMKITKEPLMIDRAILAVVQRVMYRLPTSSGGSTTHYSSETLAEWQVLTKPQLFTPAVHGYPFSHLMPGSLPPTCSISLFNVSYFLQAKVHVSGRSTPVEIESELPVKRSVINIQDKTSVRVFPPTDLSLALILPSAVFPKSSFTAEIRLEGLVNQPDAPDPQKRWKPKKLNWRFFQTVKITPTGKEPTEDTQVIGEGTIKTGWKVDYSHKGLCELIVPNFVGTSMDQAIQDVDDPVHGLMVSHRLSIEVLLAEEVGTRNSRSATVTGSARVLRMQFNISVVDRPGLGISWDDEVPPVYADVPLSPPTYNTTVEDIRNHTFSPCFSPAYSPALGASPAVPSPTLRHIDASLLGPESRRANRISLARLGSMPSRQGSPAIHAHHDTDSTEESR